MGILGLTNDEQGQVIQRLPVAIKVSIGTGPDPRAGEAGHPTKLDHFLLQRKTKRDKDIIWMPDPELHALYGDEPGKTPDWYIQNGKIKEVGIVLLDDEPDNVFPTSLAWWKATECHCRGQLVQVSDNGQFAMQAIRRTKNHPEGEPWPGTYAYASGDNKGKPVEPCGDTCPDLDRGDCKPSGDLRMILDRMPMLGAICGLHTTSYRSVRQIHSGIQQVRKMTGGRLAGIRAMLKVRPEKVTYEDKAGTKKSSTAWILSLEISATDMKKLLENMTETAQLFQQTRKLLGGGRIEVIEDEEPIRAREIAAEFYPEDQGEEEIAAPEKITETQWKVMWEAGWKAFGKGEEQTKKIMEVIASFGFEKSKNVTVDKYEEICERLRNGPPKPPAIPAAVGPAKREPGDGTEEEFALSPSEPEVAPVDKSALEVAVSPAATDKPKPKDIAGRGDAVAERLGIEPKVLRQFCASQCGVKSVGKAPRSTLAAVITALEKFVDEVGAENAGPAITTPSEAHNILMRTWKALLFDEMKATRK